MAVAGNTTNGATPSFDLSTENAFLKAELAILRDVHSALKRRNDSLKIEAARGRAAVAFIEGSASRLSWIKTEDRAVLGELAWLSSGIESAATEAWNEIHGADDTNSLERRE